MDRTRNALSLIARYKDGYSAVAAALAGRDRGRARRHAGARQVERPARSCTIWPTAR